MNEKTIPNENPEILRIQEITRRLDGLNREVDHFLSRLPLRRHEEVARLNQLIHEQIRLSFDAPRRALPPRIMVFYENARDRASFLRRRYNEALVNGALRKPDDGPP